MPLRKWSLEDLARELPPATSQRDLARRLGTAGHSTTKSIIRMADEAGMDTRHLVGKRYEQHRRTKVEDETLANLVAECFSVSEVLRKAGYTDQLRRALLEVGVPHKCARRGQQPEWMGKPLTLQAEHINGDRLGRRKENLCFLCPNCRTQTETCARRVKVDGR